MSDILSFKINIPEDELDHVRRKLELTRLPKYDFQWTEENGLTTKRLREVLSFWLEEYDWRTEEARINQLPQFITRVEVDDGYGVLDIHFLHSKATSDENKPTYPLLFLHGWPGSFIEIEKALPLLNDAGYDVVGPSLPGYGFSTYPTKRGFDHRKHAQVMNKLMHKLGYQRFFVQGGDWGSAIASAIGILYPDSVIALHQNMLMTPNFDWPPKDPAVYTEREMVSLKRTHEYFLGPNNAYSQIFAQRPLTTGWGVHDSPMSLLAIFADKLITWTDGYPWSPTEMITWTLLHYFSTAGPTAGLVMYMENNPPACMIEGSWATKYVEVPCGYSAFPKELVMVPKSWAERASNCIFYREHAKGGHFAMYEWPEVLVRDLLDFHEQVRKSN